MAKAIAAAAAEAANRDAAEAAEKANGLSDCVTMTSDENMVQKYLGGTAEPAEREDVPLDYEMQQYYQQLQIDGMIMDMEDGSPEELELLQQMVLQQRRQQEEEEYQQQLVEAAAADAAQIARPEEHFITVAKNGENLNPPFKQRFVWEKRVYIFIIFAHLFSDHMSYFGHSE